MKTKKSKAFITIGLVLIGAAFLLAAYNIYENIAAERRAEQVLNEMRGQFSDGNSLDALSSDGRPMYEKYPEMEMPLVEIDGVYYIGILEIPAIDIVLPVRGEFSYKGLKTAPCRYDGSVYLDNMIIAAHNFSSHFGRLKSLNLGDRVSFTDSDGNTFLYEVSDIMQINGADIEAMKDGEWDMTLFTCTIDGRSRVAVRLLKI